MGRQADGQKGPGGRAREWEDIPEQANDVHRITLKVLNPGFTCSWYPTCPKSPNPHLVGFFTTPGNLFLD